MDPDKLSEFATVTGCGEPDKAKFFLESAAGDVAAAVEAFFEHGDGVEGEVAGSENPMGPGSGAPVAVSSGPPTSRPHPRASAKGNVRGFNDLGGDENEDDEDKPTEWYTGGAASGSVVQDPTKRGKKANNADRLQSVLDGARASGAVEGRTEDLDPRAGPAGGSSRSFQGSGRTLGSTPGDPSGEGSPTLAQQTPAETAPAQQPPAGPETHTITFWSNGFTVNDGPLRTYDDPQNTPFMEAVSKGQCPVELTPKNPAQPININLVRKEMNYEAPPEPKYTAFSGSGRTLSGASGSRAATRSVPSSAAPVSTNDMVGQWSCDEAFPSASVQLRLRDGSRKVAKFNLTHTVRDIRAFIASALPGTDDAYTLQLAGFPPEQLNDAGRTVGDGLAGAVIIQR